MVERALAWLNRFRRLTVRYERRADIHEAFLLLGCILITWDAIEQEFCWALLIPARVSSGTCHHRSTAADHPSLTDHSHPNGSRSPTSGRSGSPASGQAGAAYFAAEAALFARPDLDVSAYRFLLNRVWHVATLGLPPPPDFEETLTQILAAGEPTDLPSDIWRALTDRRAQSIRQGPWVEGHCRPNQPRH